MEAWNYGKGGWPDFGAPALFRGLRVFPYLHTSVFRYLAVLCSLSSTVPFKGFPLGEIGGRQYAIAFGHPGG